MPILTTSEILAFTDITATAGTIISRKYIEEVQERVTLKTNNYFTLNLQKKVWQRNRDTSLKI